MTSISKPVDKFIVSFSFFRLNLVISFVLYKKLHALSNALTMSTIVWSVAKRLQFL